MSITNLVRSIPGELVDPIYAGFEFNTRPFVEPKGRYSLTVIGPSGGGKDDRGTYLTQKHRLDAKLGSGDIFRAMTQKVKPYVESIKQWGKQLPKDVIRQVTDDPIACDIVFENLNIPAVLTGMEKSALLRSLNGLYASDDVLFHYTREQLDAHQSAKRGLLLDGYLRTGAQGDTLQEMLADANFPLAGALLVHTPLDVLQMRTVGRMNCGVCGAKYNTQIAGKEPVDMFEDHNGLQSGYCRTEHHPRKRLGRRLDDFPIPVANRMAEYKENIGPLLGALSANNIPVYIVSGDLNPFSAAEMKKSIDLSQNCSPDAVTYFVK